MENEQDEKERLWKIDVMNRALYDSAFRMLAEEYPEKFDDKVTFIPVIKGKTIILTGNFDIIKTEVYQREIEYNGKKESYEIILRKKQDDVGHRQI